MRESLWQDLRLAWRTTSRNKVFAAAALGTLALGIGANTAIFSIVRGVLLRPLPYPDPDRLVRLSERHPGANATISYSLLTDSTYHAWHGASETLEGIAAFSQQDYILEGEPTRLRGAEVSPRLFSLLRATPLLGRLLSEEDAAEGAEPVVVLGEGLWRQRFGGDTAVVGRSLPLDGRPHTVVGVLPESFRFPGWEERLWTPYRMPPTSTDPERPSIAMFSAVARLKPGATPAQAAEEGTARARSGARNERIATMIFGAGGPVVVDARTLLDEMTAEARPALLVLFAGVGLVLLIACANVANLFLSRGAARRRELAVRAAVGAGRSRLVRQLLTESLAIALAGGALGILLGGALTRALPAVAPESFPRLEEVAVDGGVLAFAVALSSLAGLAAGLLPALRGSRPDLVPGLRDGAGASHGPRGRRLRVGLLAVEAALAVVLIVGASLLVRSFARLVQVDAGYDPGGVVTARLQLPDPVRTPERTAQALDGLLARVRALPGVVAAGAGNMAPFGRSTAIMGFTLRGADGQERQARALTYVVTPGYAEALRLRLRQGRLFAEADLASGSQPAVVNEEFVRQYLNEGGGPAAAGRVVGRLMPLAQDDSAPPTEIVGVVGDVLKDGLDRRPQPEIYRLPQHGLPIQGDVTVVVRTTGDPVALGPTLRSLAAEVDGQAVLDPVETLAGQVGDSVAEPRFAALLLAAFAGLALLLAATGLYGVLSHQVAQRRREMGVRMALGANRDGILRLVLRQGIAITAAGLATGLVAALALSRLLAGLLFGIAPLDPVSFALAPVLLLAVALAACLVPARRAASTDPVEALRAE